MRLKQTLWLALQLTLTLLVVLFMLRRTEDLRVQLDGVLSISHLPAFFISGIIFLIFYIVLSLHWLEVCRAVSDKVNKKQWLSFFASQPYKYLPTSLFTFSFRAKFAKDLGLSVKESSIAQLIENLNLITSATLIVLTVLIFRYSSSIGLTALLLVILIFIGLWYKQSICIPRTNYSLNTKKWIKTFFVALSAWLVAGVAFAIISNTFYPDIGLDLLIAANSAAFVSGIVAVFAPGGIGVRELVFTYFAIPINAILVWRFLTLIIDVLSGLFGVLAIKRLKKKN